MSENDQNILLELVDYLCVFTLYFKDTQREHSRLDIT